MSINENDNGNEDENEKGEQGTGSVHGLTLYISSGVRHVSECFIVFCSYKTYQNEYQLLPLLMLVWNHSVATQATSLI